MPSLFKSPVTMQAAPVKAMGVPVVKGFAGFPVPRRMERPVDVITARSGLPSPLKSAVTLQPAPPAARAACNGGPDAVFERALTRVEQHGNGGLAIGDDVPQAVVSEVGQDHVADEAGPVDNVADWFCEPAPTYAVSDAYAGGDKVRNAVAVHIGNGDPPRLRKIDVVRSREASSAVAKEEVHTIVFRRNRNAGVATFGQIARRDTERTSGLAECVWRLEGAVAVT